MPAFANLCQPSGRDERIETNIIIHPNTQESKPSASSASLLTPCLTITESERRKPKSGPQFRANSSLSRPFSFFLDHHRHVFCAVLPVKSVSLVLARLQPVKARPISANIGEEEKKEESGMRKYFIAQYLCTGVWSELPLSA